MQLTSTKCSRWLTVADLLATGCAPDKWSDGLEGLDLDSDPADWTDEQLALYTEADQHLQMAEDVLFEATGQAYPGICHAVIAPRGSFCGCLDPRRHTCMDDAAKLNLWLPYPIMTMGADGTPLRASLIADPIDEAPLPLVRGVDSAGVHWALWPFVDTDVIWPYSLIQFHNPCRPITNWPTQDPQRPPATPGTWVVEVAYGAFPPSAVLMAALRFAKALLQRSCGSGDCPLPEGITSVTVHQTVMRVAAASDWIRLASDVGSWLSGIPDIDLTIMAYVGPPAARVLPPRDQRWKWNIDDRLNEPWRAVPTPASVSC